MMSSWLFVPLLARAVFAHRPCGCCPLLTNLECSQSLRSTFDFCTMYTRRVWRLAGSPWQSMHGQQNRHAKIEYDSSF
ncbi:hypothetical protein P152DRAFT_345453 [Eremomyces bilateralis CBS 781.70]|uniref:Secreted protein n=1 Tax=Eremomyces bilateralis CBS 781.70 TaxID=1392243 RepID=A0A6G1G3M2_9PEZI|nr:uncharacterized protein P152DRAFT_345453 [Eremomyces bilateralis CBS 781.70]KAF1812664.1 hypothetical protein P152DRAFT_345453 [Eremomyces bilateralis CBS 781.70]